MNDGDSRDQTEVAVFSLIDQGLRDLSLPVTPAQVSQLTSLVALLDHWAARINLTGHRGPIEMASRLVLDAAAMAHALPELRTSESLADLGTGAGFPGLPIAILYPHLHVSLVDSRLKRHHFQREACRRLGLERVTPILGRSNEVEPVPSDLVVAQAMAKPSEALQMMAEWAHADSCLVLPASDASTTPICPDGTGNLALRLYRVPGTGTQRKLWLASLTTH
jgi:16S rRNA (guanine527-N7)-methyltransferase